MELSEDVKALNALEAIKKICYSRDSCKGCPVARWANTACDSWWAFEWSLEDLKEEEEE